MLIENKDSSGRESKGSVSLPIWGKSQAQQKPMIFWI